MENKEQIFRNKIYSLDNKQPKVSWSNDELWIAIERRRNRKYLIFRIAASISFLLALTWAVSDFGQNTTATEHIVWSEEYVEASIPIRDSFSGVEEEALVFFRNNCYNGQKFCENPEFESLTRELNETELELQRIDEMISHYGNDPVFIKSRIQVENLKTELINQLMSIALS